MMPSDDGMVEAFEKASCGQLRVHRTDPGVSQIRGRNTIFNEQLCRGRGIVFASPLLARDAYRSDHVPAHALRDCPTWSNSPNPVHPEPTSIGATARPWRPKSPATARSPRIDRALAGGFTAAISQSRYQIPISGEFDNLLGGCVECGLNHRYFDEAPLAGLVASPESCEHGESGVHSCQWVTRAAGDSRLVVHVAGHPRHSGHSFHRLRETHIVAPWSVEPERRHTDHH